MSNVSSLIDRKKIKQVRTNNLLLDGYLLMWNDVMIQVSNVSMVTASKLPFPAFPILSILLLIGAILVELAAEMGAYGSRSMVEAMQMVILFLIALSVVLIIKWIVDIILSMTFKCLNFFMNSGYTYSIVFRDNQFLEKVIKTLMDLFKGGIDERTYCVFNIQECKIENGALVNKGVMHNR